MGQVRFLLRSKGFGAKSWPSGLPTTLWEVGKRVALPIVRLSLSKPYPQNKSLAKLRPSTGLVLSLPKGRVTG
jgi:hypothetical protein